MNRRTLLAIASEENSLLLIFQVVFILYILNSLALRIHQRLQMNPQIIAGELQLIRHSF
jgi:hypothetical protein